VNSHGENAVVLLSGGLDSATTLAFAASERNICHALTFRYGQRHELELEAAQAVARSLEVEEHRIVTLPLGDIAPSALTDPDQTVPRDRSADQLQADIPSTYVPARNTIFLSWALAFAESTGADHIYCGVNAVDYSGYPDCRPEYIEAFQKLASLATKRAVQGNPPRIRAPLLHMSKAEIIRQGTRLGVDYSLTLSCYDPDGQGRACGHCDACLLRRQGFQESGIEDPTRYQP
jgi:7-cyano-7-deazaguanine synthase